MIIIVDYGVGNLGSILNMYKKIGVAASISSTIADIEAADKLILPGVGAFDYGMQKLEESGLVEALNKKVLVDKTPILGICLGLQLMTNKSEEGHKAGLGWFDAETVRFDSTKLSSSYKVPHMGWNDVIQNKQSVLLDKPSRFYFVHSYHIKVNHSNDLLFSANYGYQFGCGLERDNIAGVQFHPEKSHNFGLRLLKNFAEKFNK